MAEHPVHDSGKASQLASKLKLNLDYDQLTNCMRCGFCLPACPTFRETGIEAESPRGRIALMKAVADGIMSPDKSFEEQINHCLGCRACEPACPADVKYGYLLEQARDAIEDHTRSHRLWVRMVRHLAFMEMLPRQNRLRLLGGALRLYRKSGLRKLVRGLGVMKLFPEPLRVMESVMPEASFHGVREKIGARHPAKGGKLATVGLFRGCIMDVLFTDTNIHTVELLTEAGFEVVIPGAQNCCGALHAHSGEAEGAKMLARRNIRAFNEAGVDFIVSNAGGCGALLTEYGHLLGEDSEWRGEAASFAQRVIDISDLLVRHGRQLRFADRTARPDGQPVRITYQDSCHLRNVMRVSDAPRKLIQQTENSVFTEMKEADRCCGSAGIYNLTQPDMAEQLLTHKMEHANRTEADFILTANPGCLMQMKAGIEKHDANGQMKAVHVVDFLVERLVKN